MMRLVPLLFILLCVGCDDETSPQQVDPQVPFVRISISPNTPWAQMVQGSSTDVLFLKIRCVVSSHEGVFLTKIRLFQPVIGSMSGIALVKLLKDGQILRSGLLGVNGYATWSDLAVLMPAGTTHEFEVRCDLNDSMGGIVIGGQAPEFGIRNVEDDWNDLAVPNAPNGSINPAETGDIEIVGLGNGSTYRNSTDAKKDQIVGDFGAGAVNDSVGFPSAPFGTVLSKPIHLSNTLLNLSGFSSPSGSQGAATGTTKVLFTMTASPTFNATATNPREVFIESIRFTVVGDAEADIFELYCSDDGFTTAIATSATIHRTTRTGGDPSVAAHHVSINTDVDFTLSGASATIPYGSFKTYELRCRIYALTDVDQPTRSIAASVAGGTVPIHTSINPLVSTHTAGGVVWFDNGETAVNASSFRWDFQPMGFGAFPIAPQAYTGTSFIP